MADVIVIGAGLSGMSCAIALAKAGRSVTVLERASYGSPTVHGFTRGKVHFDCGFHYTGSLGEGEQLRELLSYLGVFPRINARPLNPDSFDLVRIQNPDSQTPIPWGWERLKDTLSQRFPTERRAIQRYVEDVKTVYDRIPHGLISENTLLDELWDEGMGPSVQEYLDDVTADQTLKRTLTAQSLLYGMIPEETPFTIHARIMGSYYQSAYAIEGGGTALVDAFTAQLEAMGVDVKYDTRVSDISIGHDGIAKAVETADGQRFEAKEIVYSGHPTHLLTLLSDHLGRRSVKRLSRLEHTMSALILFCKSDTHPSIIRDRNMFVRSGLDTAICQCDLPVSDRGFFVSYGLPVENEPDACSFTVIFPETSAVVERWRGSSYGKRPFDYYQFKTEASGELLARLEQGCPELAGKAQIMDVATPLTVQHYCSTPDAASIYGVKHKCGQIPVLPKSAVDNLFITGQAVVTPGFFGTVYSGLLTAGVMTGNERYRKELFV